MIFDDSISRLRRALARLEATGQDQPIARRNARKATLSAMRSLRAVIDQERPAIIKRGAVKRLTPEVRIARLKRAGWVTTGREHTWLSTGVVRPKKITYYVGKPGTLTERVVWFVPGWADAIGHGNIAALKKAKKDWRQQHAVRAAAKLAGMKDPTQGTA